MKFDADTVINEGVAGVLLSLAVAVKNFVLPLLSERGVSLTDAERAGLSYERSQSLRFWLGKVAEDPAVGEYAFAVAADLAQGDAINGFIPGIDPENFRPLAK